MARIDEVTIQAIRKKHPIKDIVERYKVGLTKKGEDYWGNCPFHKDVLGKEDKNASMSVSPKLDIFKCFSCRTSGNIFKFISLKEKIPYGDAIRLLAIEDGFEISNTVKKENPYLKDYEVINKAIKLYQNNINSTLGENAIKYLNNRQIDRETIQKFEIGLSVSKQPITPYLKNMFELNQLIDLGITNLNEQDVFNDRIMIPIHDLRGNPIGFGGRIYQTRDSSKYINTRATRIFDKSNILFNYHRAHKMLSKDDAIIVMEGYFDVIRAATVGIDNCVAPMGTSFTKNHVQILKGITNNVILCFDGDKPGEDATVDAIPLLEEAGLNIKVVRLEEKDPDEFIIKRGKEAFIQKINNPLNVIDFQMQILSENRNLNDLKDASAYMDEVIKQLIKEKDEFVVELTLKKLATRFQMEYESLKNRLLKYKSSENNNDKNRVVINNSVVKNAEKIPNKYGQATDNLLYYMIVSGEVVKKAENAVAKIMDDKKRRLYNEIICYYYKYGEMIIADFMTYLTLNTDVADTFEEIISKNLKLEYTIEEIEDYIKCVNEYYKKSIIDKLKLDLNKELDPMKQANILKEIMKIRGVKTSD